MLKMGPAMTVIAAIVALLVLVDAAVAVKLVSTHSNSPVATSSEGRQAGTHPCNHGFYVSKAAHAKKGGKYVSGVAQSDLGKNGNCSAPLPKAPGD